MPLNFTEVEKPKEPVEFFVTNTKARPLELEGEVVPELIHKCGDPKSGRVTVKGVEAYLDKNVLVFDRELLANLFAEADFRKEGSLDARALKAALSARYPKRQLHREWRVLTALLLGVPELVLAEDIKHPKVFEGTFNKDSVWDSPPPELPKAPPHRRRKPKKPQGEWQDTTAKLTAATSTATSTSSSTGTILTPGGVKSVVPTAAEQQINAAMQAGDSVPRSTFAASSQFNQLLQSQALASAMSATSKGPPPSLTPSVLSSSGKQSVKAWAAALPPSPISLSQSALQTLRTSVRSTMARKPDFLAQTQGLTTSELDQKKVLGQPLDVSMSLNRVEPVRDTKVLPQLGYLAWGDYASRTCRTAPTRWYNQHPAAPAPEPDHPYPW